MGNNESQMQMDPFEGWEADEDGHPEAPSGGRQFKQGQKVNYPGGNYIGAYVSNPYPRGKPNDVEVTVPALGFQSGFKLLIPKSQVSDIADDPLDDGIDRDPDQAEPEVIGCFCCPQWCGCKCHHVVMNVQPRRIISRMFCTLNCCNLIYMLLAMLLISAMGEVCNVTFDKPIDGGFQASHYTPVPSNTYAESASERSYRPRFLDEDTTAGLKTPETYTPPADYTETKAGGDYTKSETTTETKTEGDYPAAAATEEYTAPVADAKDDYVAAAAAEEDYTPGSAYVAQSQFFKTQVGPACNRLVSFACTWSILLILGVWIYGCCYFRHWRHYAHVTGFYLALLTWLAIDFLTIGVLFSIDAAHIHSIDHEMYVGGYTAHSIHGGVTVGGSDYSASDAVNDYEAGAAGHGYRHLKASSNFLSWCFELELCCAVVAFVLAYYYAWFAINLRRFANDLLNDAAHPRNLSVEGGQSRLAGEMAVDFRLYNKKSRYFSKEFEHDLDGTSLE